MNLYDRIPNNVNLSEDKRLQRALEKWLPNFLAWWHDMGPEGFQEKEVWLRTAVDVGSEGWAHFDYVKMPEYRWGIVLEPAQLNAKVGFGDNYGQPAYQEVPGEFRNALRRIIVTQGDTEPASVEQQRLLGHTCPSLYDLRNLFQVNVEEGRHLWAMAYLLHGYFGRDGRDEADELLARHSGDPDKPRILGTFNEPVADWLSFFMFTFFTDRDGRFQLKSLAESAFDPLSRSCRFMLAEEAFHMFVGTSGITRVIKRTLQVMKDLATDDPAAVRDAGAIDLPTLQRYVNFWFSSSVDLFGAEISSNAASYFATGIKGRPDEARFPDHLGAGRLQIDLPDGRGGAIPEEVPMRSAMNEVSRAAYVKDCEIGVQRWNRLIQEAGHDFRLALPSLRFRRSVGAWAGIHTDPQGKPISTEEWRDRQDDWLPSEQDRAFVGSLMQRVTEP